MKNETVGQQTTAIYKPVRVIYFTDPICSSCWVIEPELRKLKLEYGDYFDFEYHMGGLVPSWSSLDPRGIKELSYIAHHWNEVSQRYGMAIDGDIWLEDPLHSSYPPSIAFIAAKMQDNKKADAFLRRIREMVFLEKKNITRWEYLQQAALETGLEVERFHRDYEGQANDLFEADLGFAKSNNVRGFPTLFFLNGEGRQEMVYGYHSYDHLENIILSLVPWIEKSSHEHSAQGIFDHYPSIATKEFSVITNQATQDSERILEDLVKRDIVEKILTPNGPYWKKRR